MLKRYKLKKLLRQALLVATITIHAVPEISISKKLLPLLPKEAWEAMFTTCFSNIAHEKQLLKAVKKVLKKRTNNVVDIIADLLEKQIDLKQLSKEIKDGASVSDMPETPGK